MRGNLVSLALVMALAPGVAAQDSDFIQDRAGRPEVREDGARCFEVVESPETCLVLYAHVFHLGDVGRLSVQGLASACPDLAEGLTTAPTVAPIFDLARMDLRLFPSFNHHASEEGGLCDPWAHPHWGPYGAFHFATDRPIFLYWFLSADTDDVHFVADPDADVGAMPCVTVRARLYVTADRENLTLLSEASSTRTVLSSRGGAQQLPHADPCVSGFAAETHPNLEIAPAHEFPVMLPAPSRDLAEGERLLVRVEWFQAEQPTKLAQREWNLRTGPELRPRLVVPILEPIRVERLVAQPHDRVVVVNASLNTPVGVMDIDPGSLRLAVQGPDGSVALAVGEPVVAFPWWTEPLQTSYIDAWHAYEGEPANFSFGFRLAPDAPSGSYRVRLDVMNWQHTANATAETTITYRPESDRDAPAWGVLATALLVVGIALARRRR